MGGHSGNLATYHRVKQLFAWPGLRQSVHNFVQACDVCQRVKSEHIKLPGLLQPLEVPDHAWQVISMDFIEEVYHYQTIAMLFWSLWTNFRSLLIFWLFDILTQLCL